jgi:CRP/FNR family transcriptional regulator, cyclic AMP receptor protein
LLTLAESFGNVIPLTQDDVAELAGATRPTVNRVLKDAEAAGLIQLRRGRIELLDVDAIARRAR